MANTEFEINDRIDELITRLGITPYEFSKRIGNHRPDGLYKILKKESKPSPKTLNKIKANFPEEYIWVITGEGKTVKEQSKPITNTNGNKFTELPDGTYDIEVKELPFMAYASFSESLESGMAYEDFNTAMFNVDRVGKGHYMAFTVKGESMNGGKIYDTPDGAKVLGREVGKHLWKSGFHQNDYGFIILCTENIFHKDIVGFDSETGVITCHSRNSSPEYSDFELNLNDCYQIFKVIKRIF